MRPVRAPACCIRRTAPSKPRYSCRSGRRPPSRDSAQRDLAEDLGVRILLANTYHLCLRPATISSATWAACTASCRGPNAILTDSGGFQVFSLSGLRKVTEEGVIFQSHLNGDLHHLHAGIHRGRATWPSAATSCMVLDECPEYPVTHEYARQSMHRTVGWARQADRHHRWRMAESPPGTPCSPSCRAPCFPTCGPNAPARCWIWMPTAMPSADFRWASRGRSAWKWWRPPEAILPRERPRYAMGVGMPAELPEYVARGVDMMDCVLPSRNARNGYLFTSQGRVDHQTRALQGRRAARRRELRVLYL